MRGRESAADQWAAWWAVCFSFFLWLLLDLQGECCRLSGCMVVKGVLPEILSICFSGALSA